AFAELGPLPTGEGESADDAIRAAARVLLFASDALDSAAVAAIDDASRRASPHAALEWLGARARRCASGGAHDVGAADVLARLVALAHDPAPLGSRGPALA